MDNTSGNLRGNSTDDLGIILIIQVTDDVTITFSHANIKNFVYYNQMNTRPFGSFELMDTGTLRDYGLVSGMYARLAFTGASDNEQTKISEIDIYINHCKSIGETNVNEVYEIKWVAGNTVQNRRTDIIAPSNSSVGALKHILNNYSTSFDSTLEDSFSSDAMNWLVVKENMWDKLDSIVSRSYKKDDYIFWSHDDVNSSFYISSLESEKSIDFRYAFYPSELGFNSTRDGKIVKDDVTYYPYQSFNKSNYLGKLSESLFPNISFIGFPSENGSELPTADVRQEKFVEFLSRIGDNKIEEIIENTGINKDNAAFGEFKLKYHTKNGHRMYSISDIYRKYKISTYSKSLNITLYNQVGPPIGSNCGAVVYKTGRSIKELNEIDEKFTDSYLVLGKIIQYEGNKTTTSGHLMTGPTSFKTTIILGSDNYEARGKEIQKPSKDRG
jgi:hypothetical protein